MWSLMRSPFSTNARTQDSISPRCPAGRSSNWYLPLLLYENRSARRFIGDSSHVPTPLPMKYFSINSYLIFLCLPMSISPHMTRISVGTGTKYTPDVSTTASTRMRRTLFTPGRFKMLTLPALSDCGHARHIRRESITPVLRQWTLPRGSQHPRFRPLQQGVGGPPPQAARIRRVPGGRRRSPSCGLLHRSASQRLATRQPGRKALDPPRRGPGERPHLPVRPAREREPARGEPVAHQDGAEDSNKGTGDDVARKMRVNGDPARGEIAPIANAAAKAAVA